MTASEIAALLGVSERTAQRYMREWREAQTLPVRTEWTDARGRPRHIVDATADEVLLVVAGLAMAA